jgi:hypothetical protein
MRSGHRAAKHCETGQNRRLAGRGATTARRSLRENRLKDCVGTASGAKLGMDEPSDEPVSPGPASEGMSVRLSNGRAMFRSPPDCRL